MIAPVISGHRSSKGATDVALLGHQPVTADERRSEIDRISQRIVGIVRFMCDMNEMPGTSAEARDKALAAFHERLVIAEKQLAHIQDRLRLE